VALHPFSVLALYVDPGSGSMMLQLLLGGVSGVYVIFRMFKQKILGWFGVQPEADTVAGPMPAQKDDPLRPQL
jgi:hypothetical protein